MEPPPRVLREVLPELIMSRVVSGSAGLRGRQLCLLELGSAQSGHSGPR